MFSVRPPFFEGEDEAAIRAEFVRLVALYPNANPYDVALHLFKDKFGLVDPELRSQQSAAYWLRDIGVQEEIRLERLEGGRGQTQVKSKEQTIRELHAMAEDTGLDAKDRLAAYRLAAELQGQVIKAVDKSIKDTRRKLPTFVIRQYDPAQDAA